MKRLLKYYKEKKGISLILIALLIALLLFLLAMAVDISYMYFVKNQLQVAADAAALAGVVKLDGTNDVTQALARQEAWKFACKNRATNQAVFLVTDDGRDHKNPDCDTLPAVGNLNSTNDPNGDIVVGYWDGSIFNPTGTPINALKARPRMTNETPGMPMAKVFIGQVFRVIGINWGYLSARASAIASRPPLATPGIPLCLPSCSFSSFPKQLILQKDTSSVPLDNGMAWTAFAGSQAPNIGKNGDVVEYIWGKQPPPLCDLCITTNNGVGEALKELSAAFESTTYYKQDKDFDSNGNVIGWNVAVPILDRSCDNPCPPCDCTNPDPICCPGCPSDNTSHCCACPPGGQGNNNEKYHIVQIAEMHIISVNTTGSQKGVTVDSLNCIGCPTSIPPSSGGAKLVQ
jgi:hypothetical protein